ncbi:MAG: undecaprenyl/decaprenyl-phosphate alpha-N-acetylglucosaminyl 1-phosphate transferase, partial [Maribacter sp.]
MPHIQALFSNIYFLAFLSAIVALGLSLRMFPVIIHTVRTKNLMDEPGDRKIHAAKIPTMGGVGLFVAFTLSLILFGISVGLERPDLLKLLSLLAATMILLFLGIKDDLIAMSPKKKFIGQLIASAIVIIMTDVRVSSFDGLLGFGELPYVASVLFTLFVFILAINSFN